MVFVKPQLSVWERATLIFAILRALSNGILTALTGPFRGTSGSAKYINHVKLAVLRTFLKETTVRQQQAITTTLHELYHTFAKEKGFTPSDVELKDGTKAYWLGNKDAEKIVLWFHGGGYNIAPDVGHFELVNSIANDGGGKVGVLMLAYTLAPHAIYPTQLGQAVELMRYVFTELQRQPRNVMIAGDSAGANLAIGVLSHLLHPHPELHALQLPDESRLGAAILLAPWASFGTDWPSTTYNSRKDVVSGRLGDLWSQSFLGGKKSDGYSEPLTADEEWWKGLDGVVVEILICAGGDEVLVDSIRELIRRFGNVHDGVTSVVAEGEWHDQPINSVMGLGGQQSEVIRSFIKARS